MAIRAGMDANKPKTMGKVSETVDECATLLTALGKASPAMMLRLQWVLFSIRLSYAAVVTYHGMHDPSATRADTDSEKYLASWHELAKSVSTLSDLL
eukprot:4154947-Pyramimonas_sp.AAC.1